MANDAELIKRAQHGDLAAFKQLVTEHQKNVYYLAYDLTRSKEDAEDVSQEVFLKAYRSLPAFRFESKFSSWLYRITVNTCLSMKAKKSYAESKTNEKLESLAETAAAESKDTALHPEHVTESGLLRAHMEKALQKLSPNERTIFIMRNFRDMSFEEIVEVMNIRPATARNFNFKALRKLRKELQFYKHEF